MKGDATVRGETADTSRAPAWGAETESSSERTAAQNVGLVACVEGEMTLRAGPGQRGHGPS